MFGIYFSIRLKVTHSSTHAQYLVLPIFGLSEHHTGQICTKVWLWSLQLVLHCAQSQTVADSTSGRQTRLFLNSQWPIRSLGSRVVRRRLVLRTTSSSFAQVSKALSSLAALKLCSLPVKFMFKLCYLGSFLLKILMSGRCETSSNIEYFFKIVN